MNLKLGISGFRYADLYDPKRLKDLLAVFEQDVNEQDPALFAEFESYRASQGQGMKPEAISDLLVRMAPYVGAFVARLFDVSAERERQIAAIRAEFDSVFIYRNEIVGKLGARFKGENIEEWNVAAIETRFDVLLNATTPSAEREKDLESAVSRMAAGLWSLSEHYAGLAAGKPSAFEDAEAHVAALRSQLQRVPELADCLKMDSADMVEAWLDVVRRWSFAATQLPEMKSRVTHWVMRN